MNAAHKLTDCKCGDDGNHYGKLCPCGHDLSHHSWTNGSCDFSHDFKGRVCDCKEYTGPSHYWYEHHRTRKGDA